MWHAFSILRSGLGETTYRDIIRKCLAVAESCPIPAVYNAIWKLPVRGLINLNLDRLATRAFAEAEGGGRLPSEFSAKHAGNHTHELARAGTVFILNAHGTHNDASSWVMDQDALRNLNNDKPYKNFLHTVISSSIVVFLGISADDESVGGHLEYLRTTGIETQTHYWITDRNDYGVAAWAEKNGVRIIKYRDTDGHHADLIRILSDLQTFTSEKEPIPANPIRPAGNFVHSDLPTKEELNGEEPEMVRLFLNAHAQKLLEDESEVTFSRYWDFTKEYGRAIHSAWYVDPPDNVVLGYTLLREEAQGAFGTVYKAVDRVGKEVAVKILKEEIRRSEDALASFRRGVKSMRILKQRDVKGMVEYLEAAEIPAMVVMEWVNGSDLRKAVLSGAISDWRDILRCSKELASILREAHSVPERVLHRDVRPPNIMLDGFGGKGQWSVKVLDFDLSWHQGGMDRTLVHTPGASGYLAPEQIQRIQGVSTRHSAVDSFGLGMTLFFIVSGRDPFLNEHQHKDWIQTVRNACLMRHSDWTCVPERFARLIIAATTHEQHRRPDMTSVSLELSRLARLSSGNPKSESLDILAEEIAARSELFTNYEWREDTISAVKSLQELMYAELRANMEKKRITFTIRRKAHSTKGVARRTAAALETARGLLQRAGWRLERHDVASLEMNIVAHWYPESTPGAFTGAAALIDRVSDMLYL